MTQLARPTAIAAERRVTLQPTTGSRPTLPSPLGVQLADPRAADVCFYHKIGGLIILEKNRLFFLQKKRVF